MACTGDNHQFLVLAFQLLECVFAEIAGVGFFPVDEEHGVAYLVAIRENRHVDERERGGLVPTAVGIERTFVIAATGLVIGIIVFHELRCIVR